MARMAKSLAIYFMYFINVSYELIRYTVFKAIGCDAKPIVTDLSPSIALQILGIHSHESNRPMPLINFFLTLLPPQVDGDGSVELKSKSSYTDKGIESEFKFLYEGPKFTLHTFEDGLDSESDEDIFDINRFTQNYSRVKFSEDNPYTIYSLNSPLFMFTALSGHSPQGLLEFYIHTENKNKGIIVDRLSGYREGFVSMLVIDSTDLAGCTQEDNKDNPLAPAWYAFFTVKTELFSTIEETGCGGFVNVNGQMVPLTQP